MPEAARILPYDNLFLNSVTYEVWDSQKYFKRIDYGILDWLSDVGGLYDAIFLLSMLVMWNFIWDAADLFVSSELVASNTNVQLDKNRKDIDHDILRRSATIHGADEVQKHCCLLFKLKMNSQKCGICCCFKAH